MSWRIDPHHFKTRNLLYYFIFVEEDKNHLYNLGFTFQISISLTASKNTRFSSKLLVINWITPLIILEEKKVFYLTNPRPLKRPQQLKSSSSSKDKCDHLSIVMAKAAIAKPSFSQLEKMRENEKELICHFIIFTASRNWQ